jgi:hypothetical protein
MAPAPPVWGWRAKHPVTGFQAMFEGRHPTTGELLGRPHGRNAVPAFDVLVLFNPEYDPNTYSVANGQIMADFAVAQGRMPREEAEAWMRDLKRLGSQGRYFFSVNRYLFLATKRS